MFASVGGLALLAEHLPLMYPEISRQAISPDGGATTRDTGGGPAGSGSVGHDWVTIESSEDMYEVSRGQGSHLQRNIYILPVVHYLFVERVLSHFKQCSVFFFYL